MMVQNVGGGRVNRGQMIVLTLTCLFCLPSLGWGQDQKQAARELSKAFSSAAKAAMPAVVSIKVEKTISGPAAGFGGPDAFDDEFFQRFFGRPGPRMPQRRTPQKYRQEGLGSGFIISEDGYILTNNHVVGDVDKITVELKDGRTFANAKLIGTDPDTEVALIKIEGENFPVLPMGDSSKLEIGDWVIAIGSPFQLSETVTVGVVSAVGRNKMGIAAYEDFIQTDAAINPGNSGGPLVDLDGQVIGINTAIATSSGGYMGIGFAIPINMARTIGEQLKKNGKITRGFLGLQADDVDAEKAELLGLKQATGVIVGTIVSGGPADKAGLKLNDVIVAINGEKVQSFEGFRKQVALMSPGTKVRLEILRDGKTRTLTATLEDRRAALAKEGQPAEEESKAVLGLEVQNLTEDLAEQLQLKAREGVIVTAVDPDGPAAEKGIQPQDVIASVNGHAVRSVSEFTAAVQRSSKSGKVLLLVKRGDRSQFVTVNTK